jgi:hypothetical protein
MTETKPKRRWFRFSIRDLLWLTVVVAIGLGWWLDHNRLSEVIMPYPPPPGFREFIRAARQ